MVCGAAVATPSIPRTASSSLSLMMNPVSSGVVLRMLPGIVWGEMVTTWSQPSSATGVFFSILPSEFPTVSP